MTAPVPLRTRTFVDGVTEREDTDVLAFRLAAVLTRAGLVDRYGVSVRRIPVSRSEEGWGVYLADRMPDEDPPAGLRFAAPTHRAPHLRAA